MASIQIAGDLNSYYFVINEEPREYLANAPMDSKKVGWGWHWGGAYLIDDIICRAYPDADVLTRGRERDTEKKRFTSPDTVSPGQVARTFGSVARFPKRVKSRDAVWRYQHIFGGNELPSNSGPDEGDGEEILARQSVEIQPVESKVLVLSDTNRVFRDWRLGYHALNKVAPRHVIFRTHFQLGQGKIWEAFDEGLRDRLIAVVNCKELQREAIRLSRGLSWEKLATDLCRELLTLEKQQLLQAKHLVISLDYSGIFHVVRNKHNHVASLYCWPGIIGDAHDDGSLGFMKGSTAALVAAIAIECARNTKEPQFNASLQCGLQAMRDVFEQGFDTYHTSGDKHILTGEREWHPLKDPTTLRLGRGPNQIVCFELGPIDEFARKDSTWSFPVQSPSIVSDPDALAKSIVVHGADNALLGATHCRYSNLICVDRPQVESYRAILGLMSSYFKSPSGRPLSIAVFGTPGSGKSFGISQIIRYLTESLSGTNPDHPKPEELTFNISQMSAPDELSNAFHKIRDAVVRGNIPVVFWDEFDTDKCAWVSRFLSPMWDGTFRVGATEFSIGRAIFVFAGGTFTSMQDLQHKLGTRPDGLAEPQQMGARKTSDGTPKSLRADEEKEALELRQMKLPDFVSRLKGHVDIPSINPCAKGKGDQSFLLRRAIVMRAKLEREAPYLFDPDEDGKLGKLAIDAGVLHSLLHADLYKHGARSLETVLSMCVFTGRKFERSSLPSEHLLDPHVDGSALLRLLREQYDTTSLLKELVTKVTSQPSLMILFSDPSKVPDILQTVVTFAGEYWAKQAFTYRIGDAFGEWKPDSAANLWSVVTSIRPAVGKHEKTWESESKAIRQAIENLLEEVKDIFREFGFVWVPTARKAFVDNFVIQLCEDPIANQFFHSKKMNRVTARPAVERFVLRTCEKYQQRRNGGGSRYAPKPKDEIWELWYEAFLISDKPSIMNTEQTDLAKALLAYAEPMWAKLEETFPSAPAARASESKRASVPAYAGLVLSRQ